MKKKYGMDRGSHKLDVIRINDDPARFAMYVIPCKLLRKCSRDQVPTGVITTTGKCTIGVHIN
jgi:hypothetical protein